MLEKMQGRARWIPHNVNPADGLTKLKGAHLRPLLDLLNDGCYHLITEEAQLKQRKEEKENLGQAKRLKDNGKPPAAACMSVVNLSVFLSVGWKSLADAYSMPPQTSSYRAGVTPSVSVPFQELARTQESSAMPGKKRPRPRRTRTPTPEGEVGDEGDSSVSDGGTHTRRRYAPPVEDTYDGHTMEPQGPGRLVMRHEPPEPGGYVLGHPFNRIVFAQFKNLDYKDEWALGCGLTWGEGVPPPKKYEFSRDACDGMREDDLYGILNIEPDCPQTAIKKAFAVESRKWHPDKCNAAVVESATMRMRWITAAHKILGDIEARAFWDRRIAREEKQQRSTVPLPKRRPKMRGSAAMAPPVAKATVAPLQREAERLAAARSRTEQAQQAINVFLDDHRRADQICDDLDGVYLYLMGSTASTTDEFLKEIKQYRRDKVADRLLREHLREKDGLEAN